MIGNVDIAIMNVSLNVLILCAFADNLFAKNGDEESELLIYSINKMVILLTREIYNDIVSVGVI